MAQRLNSSVNFVNENENEINCRKRKYIRVVNEDENRNENTCKNDIKTTKNTQNKNENRIKKVFFYILCTDFFTLTLNILAKYVCTLSVTPSAIYRCICFIDPKHFWLHNGDKFKYPKGLNLVNLSNCSGYNYGTGFRSIR